MKMENNFIEIGKVVNTFGIKGELKIQSESDFIEYRFQVGKEIFLKRTRLIEKVKISSFRVHKGNVLIGINNLSNINDVEQFVGSIVFADKEDVPPLEDGEYMIDDIVGVKVYTKDKKYLGIVNDVIIIPSNDIIEILKEDNTKILIPVIDDYVLEINDEYLVVEIPEVDK